MKKDVAVEGPFSKREVSYMNNKWYGVYAIILGIVSFFTGEIVTFIMLGFILIALININTTLRVNFKKDNDQIEKDE
ncbi:hypothetical protein M3197_12420 [Sporosarcina aquimarina]|uniref:hypothetical protein n=1 Tax=Sporosarcina aquimarina TaxID=114975 RepID=UPI002042186D|nr:hypothetical protein [Sporosarcina aquimarina]MCM3758267.1 hypothetical protein [Sporosarcina aquimarina]